MKSSTLFALVCLSTGLSGLLPQTASAHAVPTPTTTTITGPNGVVIGEQSPIYKDSYGFGVGYQIDVPASFAPIYGFAISYSQPATGFTGFDGWSTQELTPELWDNPSTLALVRDASETLREFTPVLQFGTFASLFGSTDSMALLSTRVDPGSLPLTDLNDNDFDDWSLLPQVARFLDAPTAQSEFIAFGQSGNLLDGSVALVPEPSSFALCAISIAALAAMRRKTRVG